MTLSRKQGRGTDEVFHQSTGFRAILIRTASREHQHPAIRHSAGRHAGAVAAPHTLGGASDTLRYINLADLARGWVGLQSVAAKTNGPVREWSVGMGRVRACKRYLCCSNQSDININLANFSRGWVGLYKPTVGLSDCRTVELSVCKPTVRTVSLHNPDLI